MRYAQLGTSGLTLSIVGLGCNNFGKRIDADRTEEVVGAAIDEGITFLDTADVYGPSEEYLGRVLGARRHRVVLATKFGSSTGGRVAGEHEARGGRRYVKFAVEQSLRRLQTDWIDLLQMHEPDLRTPIEETLGALDDLVHEGKVRYIGCSNFAAWQVAEAELTARSRGLERFISVQDEYSWVNRRIENAIIPAARHFSLGVIPFFPLANGLLSGKYKRGEVPTTGRLAEPEKVAYLNGRMFDVVEKLQGFADEQGVSMIDVAIAGLAAMPAVSSVIAGATSADQVRINAASSRWEPTPEQLRTIQSLTADVT